MTRRVRGTPKKLSLASAKAIQNTSSVVKNTQETQARKRADKQAKMRAARRGQARPQPIVVATEAMDENRDVKRKKEEISKDDGTKNESNKTEGAKQQGAVIRSPSPHRIVTRSKSKELKKQSSSQSLLSKPSQDLPNFDSFESTVNFLEVEDETHVRGKEPTLSPPALCLQGQNVFNHDDESVGGGN